MAAATGDVAAVMTDDFVDLGFDIDVQDYFDFEDFDLAADEFCDAYSAFVANADANNKIVGGGKAAGGGWLAGLCGDDGEGSSKEGSPDSGVTDGPLAGEEAMSAFVAELERFMMEDGDDDVFRRDGDGGDLVEELISADGFFGDLQLATDSNGIVTVAAGALQNGEDEDDDGDVLAAREDEQASRKRARPKIKGTTMMPWRGELGGDDEASRSDPSASALATRYGCSPVLLVALMAHHLILWSSLMALPVLRL